MFAPVSPPRTTGYTRSDWPNHPLVLSGITAVIVALPLIRILLHEPDRLMATPS